MAWDVDSPLDYSATGDDIDSASQKIIATFEDVYDKLNRLRIMDADASQSVGDAVAYSIKIDTSVDPAAILMRNAANTGYVQIGSLAENLGITADSVGAITGSGLSTISLGAESSLPSSATTYDIYIAYDTSRIYIWRTGAWRVLASLQFEDLLNVSDNVVTQDEVAESGSSMIPRLNSVGEGEFDITGSPGKLADITIYAPSVSDGQVLVYNATRERWEVADNNAITTDDVSTTGEADKIVKADSDGYINIDTTGNAAKIANKEIDTSDLQTNDALIYDGDSETFVNQQIPVLNDNGVLEVSTTGSAAKWAGKGQSITDIQDGQVLVWSESANAFINANQGGTGSARYLVLYSNDEIVAEYNGSERVVVNMPAIVVSADEPTAADIWIKTEE